MLQITKDFITLLFGAVYQMTGITFPGTNFTVRQIFFGVFIGGSLIAIIRGLIGLHSGGTSGKGIGGGNNRHIKVSDERRGDSK